MAEIFKDFTTGKLPIINPPPFDQSRRAALQRLGFFFGYLNNTISPDINGDQNERRQVRQIASEVMRSVILRHRIAEKKNLLSQNPKQTAQEVEISNIILSVVSSYYQNIPFNKPFGLPIPFGEEREEQYTTLKGERKNPADVHMFRGAKGTPQELQASVVELVDSGGFDKYLKEVLSTENLNYLLDGDTQRKKLFSALIQSEEDPYFRWLVSLRVLKDHGFALDCLGMVSSVYSKLFDQLLGINFNRLLISNLNIQVPSKDPVADLPLYLDIRHLLDPRISIPIEDQLLNYRPGDYIAVYAIDDVEKVGKPKHSMIVVENDQSTGLIRVAQCTDVSRKDEDFYPLIGPHITNFSYDINGISKNPGLDSIKMALTAERIWEGEAGIWQIDPDYLGQDLIGQSYTHRLGNIRVVRLNAMKEYLTA